MDWTPEDSDYLTTLGAILASGTALLGLIVGVGQFSASARARRLIEWTSAALDSEKEASRRIILERLKLRAQGQLVASRYIPGWRFAEAGFWSLLAPAALIAAAQNGDAVSTWSTLFFGVVNLALVFRRAIRLYAERYRVAHQFAAGGTDVEPVRVDMLEQMEGGTRREFALGGVTAISVMGTGGLLALAATEATASPVGAWAFLGAFACWCCFQTIRAHARRLSC